MTDDKFPSPEIKALNNTPLVQYVKTVFGDVLERMKSYTCGEHMCYSFRKGKKMENSSGS